MVWLEIDISLAELVAIFDFFFFRDAWNITINTFAWTLLSPPETLFLQKKQNKTRFPYRVNKDKEEKYQI